MGAVYLSTDRVTGGPAAVKVLWGHVLDQPEQAERFEREAEVLQELRHPGVVGYIAHGASPGGEPWLAIEWIEGESLAQRLRRKGAHRAREREPGAAGGRGALRRAPARHRPSRSQALQPLPRRRGARSRPGAGLRHRQGRGRHAADDDRRRRGHALLHVARAGPRRARDRRARRRVRPRLRALPLPHRQGALRRRRGPRRAAQGRPRRRAAALRGLRGHPEALDDLVARMLAKSPRDRPSDAAALAGELAAIEASGVIAAGARRR